MPNYSDMAKILVMAACGIVLWLAWWAGFVWILENVG